MVMSKTAGTAGEGPRAVAKRATRNALIDAAYAEISQHGPSAPSLDAICARAGYTRGAFYVHFRDREALLVAVMDRVLGGLLQSIQAADAAAGARGTGRLAAGLSLFTRRAAGGDPTVYPDRALRFHHVLEACRMSAAIGERYRSILEGVVAWARAALEHDQRAGLVRPDIDPSAVADLVLAGGMGLLALLELGTAPDPTVLGETMIALLAPAPGPSATATRGSAGSPARRRRRSPRR